MSRLSRFGRWCALVAGSAFLLQGGGCTNVAFLDIVQTALLGITAAAAAFIVSQI